MAKELTLEQADILIDRLVDLEVEEIMNDRDALLELVINEIRGRYESMDLEEVLELAEYHHVIEDLEYVKEQ